MNKEYKIYPCIIVRDRYNGVYSGGSFTAWNEYIRDVPPEIGYGDSECSSFWDEYDGLVGRGHTPQEAYNDLGRKINLLLGE